MCKMKIFLTHGGVGSVTEKDVKPTNISQFVKFYLSTHNITNNPSGQDIGFMIR